MKKAIFLIALFFTSTSVIAYAPVARNDQGVEFFVDFSSIQKTGNTIRVWEKQNYPAPRIVGSDFYQSVRIYEEYDCKERKSRRLSWTVFSQKDLSGEVVLTNSKSSEWNFIAPDSVAGIVMNVVCKK